MRQNQVKNVPYLKDRRRELRNSPTPAEKHLWQYLKGSGLEGRKFRRQHSIEHYIADFCCPEEGLVIELDGGIHSEPGQMESDNFRDKRLAEPGYTMLRFKNEMVFNELSNVLQTIAMNFRNA